MVTALLLTLACDTPAETPADAPAATVERNNTVVPLFLDADHDGWTTAEGDCDDDDATVHPWADDPRGYDFIDEDCNGLDGPFSGKIGGVESGGWAPAGDINGDGRPDVIDYGRDSSHNYAAIQLSPYDPAHPYTVFWDTFRDVGVGDVDGDGLGEIVMWDLPWSDGSGGPHLALLVFEGATIRHLAEVRWRPALDAADHIFEAVSGVDYVLSPLDDVDGDGVAEVQVAKAVLPAVRLLDDSFALADAPWSFPELPTGCAEWTDGRSGGDCVPRERFAAGDPDGDGLSDLLTPDLLYAGATLGNGGVFLTADAAAHPGLRGYAGDVSGDGRDDLWLYAFDEEHPYGAIFVASAGTELGAPLTVFATILGSSTTGVGEAAGTLGDVDADGFEDLGTGAGGPYDWGVYGQETRLFRGARLAGTLDIDDADRRLQRGGTAFDTMNINEDEDDEVILTDWAGYVLDDIFPPLP